MITKTDIDNIKRYSFVTKVENNFSSITVFTETGKKTIQKRIDRKRLITILNKLKPVKKELIPFGVVQ